jgi:hypothetical protein
MDCLSFSLISLTHFFNALRLGVGTIVCTKLSTAIISLITAGALFILIPGVLQFLSYAKALEEEVLVEPDVSESPEVKAYLNRLDSSLSINYTQSSLFIDDDPL